MAKEPSKDELADLLGLLSPTAIKPQRSVSFDMSSQSQPLLPNRKTSETTSDLKKNGDLILYGRRWGMLLIVGLLQISNAMNWMTYAPVAVTAATHYNVSPDVINWLSLIFMVAYVPTVFPSAYLMGHKGLRTSLLAVATLNMVGSILRYAAEYFTTTSLKLVGQFVGQSLSACAQPVILACPTLLASTWFGDNERATANTLVTLFNPLGLAAASTVIPMLVNCDPDNIKLPLMVTMVVACVGFLVTLVFMQSRPPTRASFSSDEEREDFFAGLKVLVRNWKYWCLCVAFGVGTGVFNGISTLMAQIITGEGYTETEAGFASAALIGAGLVGAIVAGVLLDYTGRFILLGRATFLTAGISLATFAFFVQDYSPHPNNLTLVILTSAFLGFGFFSTLPISLELAVELTYPVPEGTSASLLWFAGSFLSIPITLAMAALKSDAIINATATDNVTDNTDTNATNCLDIRNIQPMKESVWMAAGCVLVCDLFILPLRTSTKLRRKASESITKLAEQTTATTPAVFVGKKVTYL
eukprot:m.179177 g.179177  ORF g.179177 m.179177 type:complete len:529 (-) comp31960_c0_seq2:41-1627(-)